MTYNSKDNLENCSMDTSQRNKKSKPKSFELFETQMINGELFILHPLNSPVSMFVFWNNTLPTSVPEQFTAQLDWQPFYLIKRVPMQWSSAVMQILCNLQVPTTLWDCQMHCRFACIQSLPNCFNKQCLKYFWQHSSW